MIIVRNVFLIHETNALLSEIYILAIIGMLLVVPTIVQLAMCNFFVIYVQLLG